MRRATEPRVGGGTSKKSVFFEITRKWTAKKIAKNQAKSFDFSRDLRTKISPKAQRSTILEGVGGPYVPPPHLVVNGSWARVSHVIQKYLVRYKVSHFWNAETSCFYESMHSFGAARESPRSIELAQGFWDKGPRNHSCSGRCLYLMRYKSISWDHLAAHMSH